MASERVLLFPPLFSDKLFPRTLALMLLAWPGLAQSQKFASHFPLESPAVPAEVRAEARTTPRRNPERGPVKDLKAYALESSGAVWLGSDQGAARFDPRAEFGWDRWQYFFGRRWLRDDKVRNITVDEPPVQEPTIFSRFTRYNWLNFASHDNDKEK